jgi:hypothetical protein
MGYCHHIRTDVYQNPPIVCKQFENHSGDHVSAGGDERWPSDGTDTRQPERPQTYWNPAWQKVLIEDMDDPYAEEIA